MRAWGQYGLGLLMPAALFCATGCGTRNVDENKSGAALRERALAVLRSTLATGENWPKVHAAEFLLALGYPQGVREEFEKQRANHEGEPRYRIGIWRVLARASYDPQRREEWTTKILAAFVEPDSPDRVNAVETLAKLAVPLSGASRETARVASGSPEAPLAVMATWAMAAAGNREADATLAGLLKSPDVTARRLAAYALRFRTKLSPSIVAELVRAAAAEPGDSQGRTYLLSAAFVHAEPPDRERLREQLIGCLRSGSEAEKLEATSAFGAAGTLRDIAALEPLLNDPAADARIGAASAILRIQRNVTTAMTGWDWTVIGIYGLTMLAIGFYYAGKTSTSEAYLLGNRRMNSWAVGLSLFAGIFSSITFLSVPGEIIRNGPMILAQFLAFPLIYWAVGWFVIPYFMRLRVTTAYEILESRFGLSVRLLGSGLFLVAKIVWMAVIIYATTDKVLVPLLRVDPRFAPWVCVILGGITIAYTSLGGLRAVVLTDVIQALILAGGALFCLVLVTIRLGGVKAWWPTTWAENWEVPRFGFELNARISLGWIVVCTFLWHFCTAASNQASIQRYLATRDVKAARNVMFVSLATIVMIVSFVSLIGFALLALYRKEPYLLARGQSIDGTPDQLLPRYIAFGLPPGATGLVTAGLLAAAMSALSAGLNASSSVVTVDFLARFSRAGASDRFKVWAAKIASVVIGALVILISSYVSLVPGNLLEIAYRVVNLFTVPLFILFGLAIFVPWSTSFGTWAGTLASMSSAILISFWESLTGTRGPSFTLIMPVAFVSGMGVGMLASLLPIGPRPKVLLAELTTPVSPVGAESGGLE